MLAVSKRLFLPLAGYFGRLRGMQKGIFIQQVGEIGS